MTTPATGPLLRVQDLSVEFDRAGRRGRAVNEVSFTVGRGEVLGLVGESGCGKSVTALALMRLVPSPPGRIAGGRIDFEGRDLLSLNDGEMRRLRGAEISMVFQDPLSALNPVLTVGYQVAEAIAIHRGVSPRAAWEPAVAMLRQVGLPDPELRARSYPHQISGGQRQRVMIAMGFALHPRLVIADEPTTALDVTVQRQVLDLMLSLRAEFGTSVLLITHDLGVVAETCDRVCVMYAGRIVEEGTVQELFTAPRHPYTRALLDAVPRLDAPRATRLAAIPGQPPEIFHPVPGCPFHPRCPRVLEICRTDMPGWTDFSPTHRARCHNPERLRDQDVTKGSSEPGQEWADREV